MAAATAGPAWRASAPLPRPQTAANAVRVDNWGNFLAQRIQALYEKQEHCDLTLRFPRRDFKVRGPALVRRYDKQALLADRQLTIGMFLDLDMSAFKSV